MDDRKVSSPKTNLSANDAIGARIRAARRERGLTQGELAEAIGKSGQQVQKYESGENHVAVATLLAIARALGVPVLNLFGPESGAGRAHPRSDLWTNFACARDAERLARAFTSLRSAGLRAALVQLAIDMVEHEDAVPGQSPDR
jgi:transcriptional regulator with XRE-family HTH domain